MEDEILVEYMGEIRDLNESLRPDCPGVLLIQVKANGYWLLEFTEMLEKVEQVYNIEPFESGKT